MVLLITVKVLSTVFCSATMPCLSSFVMTAAIISLLHFTPVFFTIYIACFILYKTIIFVPCNTLHFLK